MSVKKIGKAVFDIETEAWEIAGGGDQFLVNRRLIDSRKDVKAVKSQYMKPLHKNTPSRRQHEKREEYFHALEECRLKMREVLAGAYAEIMEDSFQFPVMLRRQKDYDHHLEWRYCLFEGVIYHFDRIGYSDEEMIRQIRALEASKIKKPAP